MEVVWCDVAFGSEGLIGISKTAGVGWKRAAHSSGAGGACFLQQRLLQRQVRGEERRREGGRRPGPGPLQARARADFILNSIYMR